MAPPLLALADIALTFGGTPLLDGAGLQVFPRDRVSLVGRNGSGKSTLLKIAAGLVEADGGTRFVQPGTRVAYLPQEPDFTGYDTARAYVEGAFEADEDPYRARLMLAALELSGDEATADMSGGEARRAALARTLAPEPDVLLLDEPTNHLDLPAIEWLESELKASSAAIVLISHDRRFLENLSRTTVWLDRGTTRQLDKGFAHFEEWRDEVFAKEEEAAHKLDRKIAREEDWMQGGVTARRKRNVRRVAELATLRQQKREARAATGQVKLEASDAVSSGRLVVEATGIAKAFDGQPIVDNLSLRVMRGDRLGVIGPNGAGKTTLLKMLIGELEPDSGAIRHGTNIERIWLDQRRSALSDNETLTDVLTGGRGDTVFINGRPKHVASYLKDFLFAPEQARTSVKSLSGGERARLLLARALAQPSNLMVLDEPTNDLDLETLDLLQELLADYSGTILLVSHDRDFIDRIATGVLVAEGDGRWVEYAGGYSDMIAQRGHSRPATREALNAGKPGGTRSGRAADAQATVSAKPERAKKKLSFKEKHALETLPAEIDALNAEIAALQSKLADPDLFTRDPARFEALTGALASAQSKLEAAEEQWLELEILKESLES